MSSLHSDAFLGGRLLPTAAIRKTRCQDESLTTIQLKLFHLVQDVLPTAGGEVEAVDIQSDMRCMLREEINLIGAWMQRKLSEVERSIRELQQQVQGAALQKDAMRSCTPNAPCAPFDSEVCGTAATRKTVTCALVDTNDGFQLVQRKRR